MKPKATVSAPFRGVEDDKVHPRDWAAGEIVHGDLARVALAEGWARPTMLPGD